MASLRVEVVEEFEITRSEYRLNNVEDEILITSAMEYKMAQAISGSEDGSLLQHSQGEMERVEGHSHPIGRKRDRDSDLESDVSGQITRLRDSNDSGRSNRGGASESPERGYSYCTYYTASFCAADPSDPLNVQREYRPPIKKRNNHAINYILETYKRGRDAAREEASDNLIQVQQLELQIRQLRDDYDDKVRVRDNALVSKNDEIRNVNSAILKLYEEVASLKNAADEKDDAIAALEAQKDELQQDLDDKSSQVVSLRNQVNELETQFNDNRTELSNLLDQYESIRTQLSAKESELSTTKSECGQLQSEKSSLEGRIEELTHLYDLLRKEDDVRNQEKDNISKAKDELEALKNEEIGVLKSMVDKDKLEIDAKCKSIEEMKMKVKRLEAQLKNLKKEMKEVEKNSTKARKSFYQYHQDTNSLMTNFIEMAQTHQASHSLETYREIIRPELLALDIGTDSGNDSGHESEDDVSENDNEENDDEAVESEVFLENQGGWHVGGMGVAPGDDDEEDSLKATALQITSSPNSFVSS
ncbi:hypothetical protein SeMB42_g07922 [Synchytrium endobioticum]|uniref:Uncharacterized protein n=1 Tax=Synchytrium endobioticum TaxID=286115 RepID=A0A507BSH2_9FUNG|nr:hypothetical protein SeMB42_g07922 [Synchytrium endobioticum]TPX48451.1 hypothetical protein SeLEV6574_g02015 [Synchytrium endobioticum]